MIRARRTRPGFTLVEMLVASAMMIMGMWLLSWVYQQGLESFRQARAQADLTAQQRMVTSVLTRDLTADHFLDDDSKPNHGRRLSDQTKGLLDGTYTLPRGGFFNARSNDTSIPGNTLEALGLAADGFASSRSTKHFLHFTVLLPGGPSHQVFSATVPASSTTPYFGTAAEVAYYLVQNGQTANGLAQLYDLYREQRIVARTSDDAPGYDPAMYWNKPNSPDQPDTVSEVMVTKPGNAMAGASVKMATLSDLIASGPSGCRLPAPAFVPIGVGPRYATDKLMSNVLSFEVKFTGSSSDGTWPRPFSTNTDAPYDTLPNDGQFDTYGTQAPNWNTPLKPVRITGVMIRLRSYDARTRSARQTTLTLDL